jgi:hypothetical protein
MPTIFCLREYQAAGGLMSYGPSFTDLLRHAADYVDKIFCAGRSRAKFRSSSRPSSISFSQL